MRFWIFFIFCLYGYFGYAQTRIPISGTYSEKYYFLDTNHFFNVHTYAQLTDSFTHLEKNAEAAGDDEFSGKLKLYAINKLYREDIVSRDTLEKKLLDLDSAANQNKLKYLEADILQVLGDICFDNKQQTTG